MTIDFDKLSPEKLAKLEAFVAEGRARRAQELKDGTAISAPPLPQPQRIDPSAPRIGQPQLQNNIPQPPWHLLAGEQHTLCMQIGESISQAMRSTAIDATSVPHPHFAAADIATIHIQAPINLRKLYAAGSLEQLHFYTNAVPFLDRIHYVFAGEVPAEFRGKGAPLWRPGNARGLSGLRKTAKQLADFFKRG